VNPRFEALVVAVGRNPSAFPKPREIEGERVWLPIEQVVCRERLSKEEARAKGKMNINSIDVQTVRNDAHARREGWKVLKHFADSDLSGEVFEEGAQWIEMMKFLRRMTPEDRERTAVLFKTPDRAGRELRKMENVRYELEEMGVRMRFADFPTMTPEDNGAGWLQWIDFAKMATFERLLIKSRTKDALDERVDRGVHLGHFPKHFGQDDQGRIEPDRTAEQVVNARLAGMSYTDISHRTGIPDDEAYAICVFIRTEVERLAIRVKDRGGE